MIQDKIISLSRELKALKEKQKESVGSVIKETEKGYFTSFKDKCYQVLCLINGEIYKPYSFEWNNNLRQGKEWKGEEEYDYCNIYATDGFGSPVGFIALESGLFEATRSYHNKMWVTAILDSWEKETGSFDSFQERLKQDLEFLKKRFEKAVEERSTGAYSTNSYIETYENKRLKIPKHYIYFKETSRRL